MSNGTHKEGDFPSPPSNSGSTHPETIIARIRFLVQRANEEFIDQILHGPQPELSFDETMEQSQNGTDQNSKLALAARCREGRATVQELLGPAGFWRAPDLPSVHALRRLFHHVWREVIVRAPNRVKSAIDLVARSGVFLYAIDDRVRDRFGETLLELALGQPKTFDDSAPPSAEFTQYPLDQDYISRLLVEIERDPVVRADLSPDWRADFIEGLEGVPAIREKLALSEVGGAVTSRASKEPGSNIEAGITAERLLLDEVDLEILKVVSRSKLLITNAKIAIAVHRAESTVKTRVRSLCKQGLLERAKGPKGCRLTSKGEAELQRLNRQSSPGDSATGRIPLSPPSKS